MTNGSSPEIAQVLDEMYAQGTARVTWGMDAMQHRIRDWESRLRSLLTSASATALRAETPERCPTCNGTRQVRRSISTDDDNLVSCSNTFHPANRASADQGRASEPPALVCIQCGYGSDRHWEGRCPSYGSQEGFFASSGDVFADLGIAAVSSSSRVERQS